MTLTQGLRYAGMFALACTGIGAIYMLSRMIWVRPQTVAIIDNYSTKKKEVLEAGVHIILNPYRYFVNEVSTQTQVTSLKLFTAKSVDNVDCNVLADVSYKITDPELFENELASPMTSLLETVKAAFSAAIQTLDFKDVTSAEVDVLARKGGHKEGIISTASTNVSIHNALSLSAEAHEDSRSREEKATDNKEMIHKAVMAEHGATYFKRLGDMCAKWGIEISNYRIISVEAKHPDVSSALESIAKTRVQAEAQRRAAISEAATKITLAEADKQVQIIRTQAMKESAEMLGMTPGEIYNIEAQVRIADKLGKGGVLVNAGSFPLFAASGQVDRNRMMAATASNVNAERSTRRASMGG
jgi:regulator of protease activity HflC (stomatin/prohibitin superfamily)